MAILDRNAGTFNGSSFNVTRSTGSFGTGTVIVIAVFANTVINTPATATQRTSSVVNIGLYAYDLAGTGQASIAMTNSAGIGEWFVWELTAGSTYVTSASAQNTASTGSYAVTSITPTSGDRHILVVAGGNGPSAARTVTAFSNSFTEFADLQVTTTDWTFSAGADLDVTANGSTAYTTTATFSGTTAGVQGGINLAYVAVGGSTPITVTESGSAAEATAVTATVPLSQAASSAEAATISAAVPAAETASSAEALATAVTLPVADAGSAAEVLASPAAVPLGQTGSAAEALTLAAITTGLAESGSAADSLTLATVTIALTDAGSAADTLDAGTGTPKTLTDAGSAAEALTVTVTLGLTQTASAADSLAVAAALGLADAAAAAQSFTVAAAAALADAASAVESVSANVLLNLTQSGTAADSLTSGAPVVYVPPADLHSSGSPLGGLTGTAPGRGVLVSSAAAATMSSRDGAIA